MKVTLFLSLLANVSLVFFACYLKDLIKFHRGQLKTTRDQRDDFAKEYHYHMALYEQTKRQYEAAVRDKHRFKRMYDDAVERMSSTRVDAANQMVCQAVQIRAMKKRVAEALDVLEQAVRNHAPESE